MVDIDKELGLDNEKTPQPEKPKGEPQFTQYDFLGYIDTKDIVKELHKYRKKNNILRQILIKHSDLISDIEKEINRYERLLNLALDFKKSTLLPTETYYKNNIFSLSTYNKFAMTEKVINEETMQRTFTNLEDVQRIKHNIEKVPGVEKGIVMLSDIADKIQELKKMADIYDKSVPQRIIPIEEGKEGQVEIKEEQGEIPASSVVEMGGEKK